MTFNSLYNINSLYDLDVDLIRANYHKFLQFNETEHLKNSYTQAAEVRVDYYYQQLIKHYAHDIIKGVKEISEEIYNKENLLVNVCWSNLVNTDFTDEIAVRKFYSYNDNYDAPVFLLSLSRYLGYAPLSITKRKSLVKYCANLLMNDNLSKDVWRTVFVNLMEYILVKGRCDKEDSAIITNIFTNVAKPGVNIEDYQLGMYAIGFIQSYPNYATRELIDNSCMVNEMPLVPAMAQLLDSNVLSDDITNYLKIKMIESGRVNDYIQSLRIRRINIESVENGELPESIAKTTDYFYQSLPDDYRIGVIL